jgi:hypothetical protein
MTSDPLLHRADLLVRRLRAKALLLDMHKRTDAYTQGVPEPQKHLITSRTGPDGRVHRYVVPR